MPSTSPSGVVPSASRTCHVVGAVDHVGGGEDQAVGVVDEARAEALAGLDLDDGRRQGLGHRGHRLLLVTLEGRRGGGDGCALGGLVARQLRRGVVGQAPGAEADTGHDHGGDHSGGDAPSPPAARRPGGGASEGVPVGAGAISVVGWS